MSKGRHCAGRAAGGRRKAPPQARRASPVRVGGTRVAGRRVSGGGGRPAALTALGSGEKVLALIPLAILSAASVAGLTTGLGDDGQPTTPTTAGPAAGRTVAPETPSAARPTMARTTAPVERVAQTRTERVQADPAPAQEEESTTTAPPAAPAERSRDGGAGAPATPTQSPATPTETPAEPPADDGLTKLEATTQCLTSGISALDVAALAGCVEDLLG